MQKRLGTVQNFTLTQTSQVSAKFGSQTYRVRVAVGSISSTAGVPGAWILFGDTTGLTVSSTNGSLVPAGWSEDFDVTPGQTFYTVASSTTALGSLSVTELT
jgi:hypothetical protein